MTFGKPAMRLALTALIAFPLPAPAAEIPTAAAVLAEINRVRADPPGYARELRAWRALYRGKIVEEPGRPGLVTREGRAAVDEAIRTLRRQRPLPPLATDAILAQAAADHVREQGHAGLTGHAGRDGSYASGRIRRHGPLPRIVGENIGYGPDSAAALVREFTVDDGVADRGHRRNLFAPMFARGGAACGPHRDYGAMCVVVFASGESR